MAKTSADIDGARRAAVKLIDYYGITDPKDIDLEAMAWGLGVDVKEATLHSSEAQLIRQGRVGVIRVRRGETNLARRRFSIAHELGHWILHPSENQYWISTAEQIHLYAG